jgi:hypothetical protein
VDVDRFVLADLLEADVDVLLRLGVGQDLATVERQNMPSDCRTSH